MGAGIEIKDAFFDIFLAGFANGGVAFLDFLGADDPFIYPLGRDFAVIDFLQQLGALGLGLGRDVVIFFDVFELLLDVPQILVALRSIVPILSWFQLEDAARQ